MLLLALPLALCSCESSLPQKGFTREKITTSKRRENKYTYQTAIYSDVMHLDKAYASMDGPFNRHKLHLFDPKGCTEFDIEINEIFS